ncbi:Glycine dehydrogenase [decarboxylating] (glycine cleavage system P1 protein) [hydrothermal vent metagenome]|uniref:glycine dehydrogenase (aminomethyl-transferring) n=1 Tax=hydrothermal vent metagenome TaxID=652676 RepID=A0A3B0YU83_9ZZZZ
MPFIPHTDDDVKEMLSAIGAEHIDDLFDEIPAALKKECLASIETSKPELEVSQQLRLRASIDTSLSSFLGAGAYEHHIPAAVWEITTRGEFYTAYTPYQAEASQGSLQALYEYQTMIANLTALDVSNGSLYDGASALAEAALMAVRANRKSKSKRILIPRTVHPAYRKVVHAIVRLQGIILEELDYDSQQGSINPDSLPDITGDFAALIIPQPNFFGRLEEVDTLTRWAHSHQALVIAVVNPTSMAVLHPPGEWGDNGADIACGEGQPLGIPLNSGGPYFGFMSCKQAIVRQMPGRIVGQTVDLDGKRGFSLTLQAREQHIRRSKATSNICTNQGLMVTAATIYMTLMGPDGLASTASNSHAGLGELLQDAAKIKGVEQAFSGPCFHEAVLKFDKNIDIDGVLNSMLQSGILAGYKLANEYPELDQHLLVCVTETKSTADKANYIAMLKKAVAS